MINKLFKDTQGYYMRSSGMCIPVMISSEKEISKAEASATWLDREV